MNDSNQAPLHPGPYPNNNPPFQYDFARQRSLTTGYIPQYPPPFGLPPPMPIPSVLTPGGRPFVPAPQVDLLFPTPGAYMSITRSVRPPAPAIPPHPYSMPPDLPSPTRVYRSRTAPPPIPPKIPINPSSTISQAPPALPTRVPSFQIPSTQIPSLPGSSTELPSFPAPSVRVPSPQVPFAQTPGPPVQAASSQALETSPAQIAEEDELAMVLALSASESGKQQKLRAQEDEELARALEMSMALAESESERSFHPQKGMHMNAEAGPSTFAREISITPSSPVYPNNQPTADSPPNAPLAVDEQELPTYVEAVSAAESDKTSSTSTTHGDGFFLSSQHNSDPSLLHKPSIGSIASARSLISSSSGALSDSASVHSIPRPKTADGMRVNPPHIQMGPTVLPHSSEPSPSAVHSLTQFIDTGFLKGVSIGFTPPVVTAAMPPFQGPLPNIVALPYGQCPPLHFQAPSWRHLLVLMARLSTTRIEATMEAIALTKTALKLRTVIQFVKVLPSQPDWRTIIWLTLDHPVPSTPGSWKYTNNDVNTLPWTYTLSPIPALLRDSADGVVSKYYTIPSTASIPYPSLPISFPDMAMYLNAVLEDSRRVVHDSSSGVRRLAKMVDFCYPGPVEDEREHDPERRGVGGLIRSVIGRGHKKREGRGNEDTYDLVTPFVLDSE